MMTVVEEKKVAALVVHGMGKQSPDFADEFKADLLAAVDDMGYPAARLALCSLYWADVTQPEQQRYYSAVEAGGDIGQKKIRRFVVNAFGDATAYQRVEGQGTYGKIHDRVRGNVEALFKAVGSQNLPLVVIAHSLGAHIMSNYIWDQQHPDGAAVVASSFEQFKTHAGMLTFGCNIPLFTFAYDPVVPISFPGSDLSPSVKAASKWLNYYDKDDVLGWPLKPVCDAYDDLVAADVEMNVGGGFTNWNPASHSRYWSDDDFVDAVAEYLCSILDAAGVAPVRRVKTAAQRRAVRVADEVRQVSLIGRTGLGKVRAVTAKPRKIAKEARSKAETPRAPRRRQR